MARKFVPGAARGLIWRLQRSRTIPPVRISRKIPDQAHARKRPETEKNQKNCFAKNGGSGSFSPAFKNAARAVFTEKNDGGIPPSLEYSSSRHSEEYATRRRIFVIPSCEHRFFAIAQNDSACAILRHSEEARQRDEESTSALNTAGSVSSSS